MHYNVGKFTKLLHLMEPAPIEIDKMGGIKEREYTEVGKVMALQRDKTSTYKQVIGDYVTVNTCYFIIRDCRSAFPIRQDWHIKCENCSYVINSITLLDDSRPYYIEIEATRLGGIG